MTNFKETKDVVQRFMGTTLKELWPERGRDKYYSEQCFIGRVIAVEALDKEQAENMDYIDICVFLEGMRENDAYGCVRKTGRRADNKLIQLSACRMLKRALLDAANVSCVRIEDFLKLRLSDFYAYLDIVNPEGELMAEYELVNGIIANVFEVKECPEYTVADALMLCKEQMEKACFLPGMTVSQCMKER